MRITTSSCHVPYRRLGLRTVSIGILFVICWGKMVLDGAAERVDPRYYWDPREWSDQHKRPPIPLWESDPENFVQWTTPKTKIFPCPEDKHKRDWKLPHPDNVYVGNLLAGRSEYNWLVDIRFAGTNQFNWSVGNLITAKFVLTTAHGILPKYHYGSEIWTYPPKYVINEKFSTLPKYDNDEIPLQPPADIFIAPQYTYPTYVSWGGWFTLLIPNPDPNNETKITKSTYLNLSTLGVEEVENIEVGRRQSHYFFVQNKYLKADVLEYLYDFALLLLNFPVLPIVPIVGYMPIDIVDVDRMRIFSNDKEYLEHTEKYRQVCRVATYARQKVGWYSEDRFNPDVTDHKVRFRVFPAAWEKCADHWKIFAPGFDLNKDVDKGKSRTLTDEMAVRVVCYETRGNKTVCDHDRGAPLVCDNQVYGFVVKAVEEFNCSYRVPMPFVVLKTHELVDIYTNNLRQFYPTFTGSVVKVNPQSRSANIRVNFFLVFAVILSVFLARLFRC